MWLGAEIGKSQCGLCSLPTCTCRDVQAHNQNFVHNPTTQKQTTPPRHLVIQKLAEITAKFGNTAEHRAVEYGLIHLLMNIRNYADFPLEVNLGFVKCIEFVEKKEKKNVIKPEHAAALITRLHLFKRYGDLLFPGLHKG